MLQKALKLTLSFPPLLGEMLAFADSHTDLELLVETSLSSVKAYHDLKKLSRSYRNFNPG